MIDDFAGTPKRPKTGSFADGPFKHWQSAAPKRELPALDEEATITAQAAAVANPEEEAPAPPPPATNESDKQLTGDDSNDTSTPNKATPQPKPKKKTRVPAWLKDKRVLLGSAAGLLIIGGAVATYLAHRPAPVVVDHTVVAPKKPPPPPQPTTEPSRLTGVQVSPDLNLRPITGVMIENSPDARPQSGLKDAGVVFEAIAEGGITRFLALFEEAQPDYIGPVRSARPYYLDWLLPFQASLAHVGGSPDALGLIKSLGVRDLDQFANGGSYQRIASRFAPHNVYTSTANLDALEKAKGFTTSTFTSFLRKAEAPSAQPTARSIDFSLSGYLYNVHYDYDAPTNSYKRSEGGKPHVDERSGAQLSPKVVVALVMNYSLAADGVHSIYNTVGSGQIYVFQDGVVTTGTWSKAGSKDQFVFSDAAGAPLKLNPGQTWISAVANTGAVTYKP